MSTFKNWTDAEVAFHNAKLKAPRVVDLTGDGCSDESKLHEQIIAEVRARGWYVVHSRLDRRTTNAVGTPDMVIAANNGKTYWLELKTAKGKLTREQSGTIHWLQTLGHTAEVVRSLGDFLKAIEPNSEVASPGMDAGSRAAKGSDTPP